MRYVFAKNYSLILDCIGIIKTYHSLLQAIYQDNAKAVDALIKNGAKIEGKDRRNADGKKYQNILLDEILRRVGIHN